MQFVISWSCIVHKQIYTFWDSAFWSILLGNVEEIGGILQIYFAPEIVYSIIKFGYPVLTPLWSSEPAHKDHYYSMFHFINEFLSKKFRTIELVNVVCNDMSLEHIFITTKMNLRSHSTWYKSGILGKKKSLNVS